MLARTRLSNDTSLTQFLRQESLAQHVVNLVRTRVVEILTLQEHANATQVSSKARSLGEQRRTPRIIDEQVTQANLERPITPQALPRGLYLFERPHQRFSNEAPAKITEVRSRGKVLSAHRSPS